MSKLSKSDAGKSITRAQVLKSHFTGNWLAVCQEGCGMLSAKQNLPHHAAFAIAERHMAKFHEALNYRSEKIHVCC